ncbi:MAG: hypothetical protein IPP94_10085 [Ignavibacteria bacterium]|nr:hypothetical protein [Ignavibacteria bacterium]
MVLLHAQPVSLDRFPAPLQLYPRGADDSASVTVAGRVLAAGYDSAIVEVLKNGTPLSRHAQALQYSAGAAAFSFAPRIHAELSEYRIILSAKNTTQTLVLAARDSIVCGDVFLINGQSNSWPADGGATYVNEYCRGFGRSTGYNAYDPADTLWALARGTGAANYLGHAGVWGLRLLQYLKETYAVPVALLNGGSGGSSIEYNLPSATNRMDLGTTYGRLLYRAEKAGVRDGITAILWHQGESNTDATWAQYADNFRALYNAWKQDYTTIRGTYVFQVRPGCGGAEADKLREVQRRFPETYPDLEIMSTTGLPGHDGCHYALQGYHEMALTVFRQLARDHYGSTDVDEIDPPSIFKAWYTTPAHTELRMIFSRTRALVWPADTLGHAMREAFFLDGAGGLVAGGAAREDTVVLTLAQRSDARTVTYIPPVYYPGTSSIYEGPWLKNARGIGALTFSEYPILFPPDGVPVLRAPAPWATDQPSTLQFRWSSVAHAARYRLQVCPDSLFLAAPVLDELVADTAVTRGSFAAGARLAWRVRAENEASVSGWSGVRVFSVLPPPPEPPLLESPGDGATGLPALVPLRWHPVDGALRYEAQTASDPTFLTLLGRCPDQPDTACAVAFAIRDSAVYWRVRAFNARSVSAWSETWSFRIAPLPPERVVLEAPAHASVLVPVHGKSDVASRGARRAVRGAAFRGFTVRFRLRAGGSGDGHLLRVCRPRGQRAVLLACARDEQRRREPVERCLVVYHCGRAPAKPLLLAPKDGSVDIAVNAPLRWRSSPDATGYRAQIAEDSAFTVSMQEYAAGSDTTVTTGALKRGTGYFWRVRAEGSPDGSGWSGAWRFRTVPDPPPAVLLLAPTDDARNMELPITLRWRHSDGAASYRFETALDTAFQNTLDWAAALGDTSWRVVASNHGTRVYWRVRAQNTGGVAPWSDVWSFVTAIPLPTAPELRYPFDSSAVGPGTGRFIWKMVPYADAYRLELSTDSGHGAPILDTIVTGSEAFIDGLLAHTRYFWRMRASNARGEGSWSPVRTFITRGLPESPVPLLPATNARDLRIPVRCVWTRPGGAEYFDLQVAGDGAFQTGVTELPMLRDSTAALAGLDAEARYYWRVRAGNAAGVSAWSAVSTFITAPAPPAAPALRSPSDSARVSSSPVLHWSAAGGATSYRLQIASDTGFAILLVNDSLPGATSYSSIALPQHARLWWHVLGTNAGGRGPWSTAWSFTIEEPLQLDGAPAADGMRILGVYPNPLRRSGGAGGRGDGMLMVRYSMPRGGDAEFVISDALGRNVERSGIRDAGAGVREFGWNPRDAAPGIYIVTLCSGTRRVSAVCVLAE